MPKLGTNTVIANGVLLNSDGHPCALVNGDGPPCVLLNSDGHLCALVNGDGPPCVLLNGDKLRAHTVALAATRTYQRLKLSMPNPL